MEISEPMLVVIQRAKLPIIVLNCKHISMKNCLCLGVEFVFFILIGFRICEQNVVGKYISIYADEADSGKGV